MNHAGQPNRAEVLDKHLNPRNDLPDRLALYNDFRPLCHRYLQFELQITKVEFSLKILKVLKVRTWCNRR